VGFTVVDESQVEPFGGMFFKMRQALGATGLGINTVRLPPGASGPPHDETQNGHEEVYVVTEGSGWLEVGDERVELVPGRWLRIDATEHRQLHAGPDGICMIAAGSTPDAPYTPNQGL
jgi:quercetin dioxygenase-like cupin family protein